ncbi:hypothetical protein [Methylocaldum gracile]|jgi:hypothetical protein|uniref:hypothetical protein n=1 Tax=Methylocaldum sp. 0917 TaxID=2485163 RepID=UPI00105F9D47
MKMKVMAVMTRSGLAKASGKPYEMHQVKILVPLIEVERETFQLRGFGNDTAEVSVSKEFFPRLEDYLKKELKESGYVEVDLKTSMVGRGELLIIGFESGSVQFAKTGTNP